MLINRHHVVQHAIHVYRLHELVDERIHTFQFVISNALLLHKVMGGLLLLLNGCVHDVLHHLAKVQRCEQFLNVFFVRGLLRRRSLRPSNRGQNKNEYNETPDAFHSFSV